MEQWVWTLRRLDLDPVTIAILGVMLLLRIALARSVRHRRQIARRMSRTPPPSHREALLEWLDAGLLFVGMATLVIKPWLLQVWPVESAAMAPTCRGSITPQIDGPNDRLLVNKYLYYLRAPQRGEVVICRLPDPAGGPLPQDVVRRIVALPGDEVSSDETGRLVINGRVQDEPYVEGPTAIRLPQRRVPAGWYMVLGDNRRDRDAASESLRHLLVAPEDLRGKVVGICWPPERMRLF